MANTIANQRTILEVKKPVRFLVRPITINFCQKNWILSRDLVPFSESGRRSIFCAGIFKQSKGLGAE